MRSARPSRTAALKTKPAKRKVLKTRPQPLGRRPGRSDTRETILDAAEEAFAAQGFTGAPLRLLADAAGVNQALIFHYFGSKEGLYRAVFLRRGKQLAQDRLTLLAELERRTDRTPSVEELVRAYLAPAFDLKRTGPGGIAFLNLQARLHTEPAELTEDLRGELYDEPMQRYVAAFQKALPGLDAKSLSWRMVFSIGAYLYTIGDLHRMRVLSAEAAGDEPDLDGSFAQLVVFIAGGLRAQSSIVGQSVASDI